MAKLFSEKSMVIVKKYGRLFLRNTTLFFNPNPSLSQETALRRFIPCTLDTSLPNPNSNLFKIGLYLVLIKLLCTLGAWQNFCQQKTRVGARRIGFLRNPNILTPTLFFFLTNKFCTVLSRVYWAQVLKFKFNFVKDYFVKKWFPLLIKHN